MEHCLLNGDNDIVDSKDRGPTPRDLCTVRARLQT